MSKRESNIDVFKGMAIFFVVLGHVPKVPSDVFNYIYSFHVPLFFFCSGYLMYKNRNNKINFSYVKNLFKKVMIPFFLAYLFSYIVTLFFDKDKRTLSFFLEFIKGGIMGSHWMDVNNFPLWFLPLFFISTLVFKVVTSYSLRIVVGIGFISFLVSPYVYLFLKNPDEKIFWSINVLFPALFFMVLGYLMQHFNAIDFFDHPMSSIFALLCGGIGLIIAFQLPSEILYIENHWYLIGAVFAIIFFVWLNKDNKNSIIQFIGQQSMIILLLHKIINYVLLQVHFDKFLQDLNLSGVIYATTFSIIIIVITLIPSLFNNFRAKPE